MLAQLIYFSRRNPQITVPDVRLIAEQAMRNNTREEITGLLLVSEEYFLQIIEGPSANVSRLYSKIVNDPRNSDAQLISFEKIDSRVFPDWSMNCICMCENHQELLNLFFDGGKFDPEKLRGDSARAFFLAFPRFLKRNTAA